MTGEPARAHLDDAPASTTGEAAGQLRLVIVGHVDHGKSTLIGRLLHDTGSLREGQLEHLQGVASRRGMALEFANLTDALQAERDQNVTIDTAQVWFRTPRREYVLIDAPGHEEFLKNMVTGAARADAALVVIDAREGVQDQSRRHGHLLKLLGIAQVAVIVNKLDLVGYSQDAFARVAAEYGAFLGELGLTPTAVIPVSASLGENVARPSAAMPWHSGGTILDVLDTFTPIARDEDQPLRFPLQAIYRFDHRRVMAGRIESGTLRVGDRLMFLPSRKQSTVRTIEQWNAPARLSAGPGESIGITIDDPLFLARGDVGCRLQDVGSVASRFTARVFWLGRVPLACGRPYKLKLATQEVECEIHSIARVVDAASLDEPHGPEASAIGPHEVGDVGVQTRRPLALDRHRRVPHLGRFVLVDGYDVAGGGIVLDTEEIAERPAAHAGVLTPSSSHVAAEARHARNGHTGGVVWFTGLSGSGKSTIARAIEQELFGRGWQVCVLDGDNVRTGLNADLGFSVHDRAENIRRIAEVAKLFAHTGVIAVTALISPTRRDRLRARAIVEEAGDVPFLEVHLSTPLACCEARDPKGLYARARKGEISMFTGVSAPFEAPDAAELTIDTSHLTVTQAVDRILARLAPAVEAGPTLG